MLHPFEKIPIVEEILAKAGVSKDQVAYIGDDLTDIVVMNRVGLSVATANARPEVKGCAKYVTSRSGGNGAVREVIELVLKAQGHWDELLRKYEVPSEAAQVMELGVERGRDHPHVDIQRRLARAGKKPRTVMADFGCLPSSTWRCSLVSATFAWSGVAQVSRSRRRLPVRGSRSMGTITR